MSTANSTTPHLAGPYYVTRDDETGNAYVNDERDSAYSFDCGVCDWQTAQQYADEMNLHTLTESSNQDADGQS